MMDLISPPLEYGNMPDTERYLAEKSQQFQIKQLEDELNRLVNNGVSVYELGENYVIYADQATGTTRVVSKEVAEAIAGRKLLSEGKEP